MDVLFGEGLEDVVVLAVDGVGGGGEEDGVALVVVVVLVSVVVAVVVVFELFLFKDFPPLAESLGGAAGDLGGYLLPLVAVLSLEGDDKGLLFWGEGALLDAWF